MGNKLPSPNAQTVLPTMIDTILIHWGRLNGLDLEGSEPIGIVHRFLCLPSYDEVRPCDKIMYLSSTTRKKDIRLNLWELVVVSVNNKDSCIVCERKPPIRKYCAKRTVVIPWVDWNNRVLFLNHNSRSTENFFVRELWNDYTYMRMIMVHKQALICEAIDRTTNRSMVCVKKYKDFTDDWHVLLYLLREIKILRALQGHPNIINLKSIKAFKDRSNKLRTVYLFFEKFDASLADIFGHDQPQFSELHVKYITFQILRGLKYMHSANIVHRDLHPGNVLINNNCKVVICDFNMARGIDGYIHSEDEEQRCITRHVVARCYRSPEVLLLEQIPGELTKAMDIWSVACIMAELWSKIDGKKWRQLFGGVKSFLSCQDPNVWYDRQDQLSVIFKVLGTPTSREISQMASVHSRTFLESLGVTIPSLSLEMKYPNASTNGIDLILKMLTFLPQDRISATNALLHEYFGDVRVHSGGSMVMGRVKAFECDKRILSRRELRDRIVDEVVEFTV